MHAQTFSRADYITQHRTIAHKLLTCIQNGYSITEVIGSHCPELSWFDGLLDSLKITSTGLQGSVFKRNERFVAKCFRYNLQMHVNTIPDSKCLQPPNLNQHKLNSIRGRILIFFTYNKLKCNVMFKYLKINL